MCVTCGCSDKALPGVINLNTGKTILVDVESGHGHIHDHIQNHTHDDNDHDHGHEHGDHEHSHEHPHSHSGKYNPEHKSAIGGSTTIALEEKILAKNDLVAARNRGWFEGSNILALNLLSAPGAGKTSLLERTIQDLKVEISISVVEGDQATTNDAERIKKTGCSVVQINTGAGCHLDAPMLSAALEHLNPPKNSLVFIENVGNLVCPALFDLGEKNKVVILSVAEGEDKPVKYPHMFRAAEILILNKIDLLPHLDFDIELCKQHALSVNPRLTIFELSARSGNGLEAWYDWLRQQIRRFQ